MAVLILNKTGPMSKSKDDHNRDEAYTLDDPAKHRRYYDEWASTYDDDFLKAEGYAAPYHVAQALANEALANDTPIADIGCGTGAVGRSLLQLGATFTLDGFDISKGMLDEAQKTGQYRNLICADFTQDQTQHLDQYGAIVSSGTFTLGHLGPEDLGRTLALGHHDALVLISINEQHFEEKGFKGALQDWCNRGMITEPDFHQIGLYFDPSIVTADSKTGLLTKFRLIK